MDGSDGSGEHGHRTHWRNGSDWVQWSYGIHRTDWVDWNDGSGKYSDGTHWRDGCDWV